MRVGSFLECFGGSRNNKPIVVDHISPGTIISVLQRDLGKAVIVGVFLHTYKRLRFL